MTDLRGATAVQVGDNPTMNVYLGPQPPWWARSGYVEQIREIAPAGGLVGRDAELAELAAFCAGDLPYLWWQAGPWAGKSALMSTFVLHPPPDVEVVSFFVTARLAEQSDSGAFTDALIDQLSALLGESLPATMTASMRDAHRRALLRAAAEKLQGEGRRLVLVVDGLDEDRGGQPGSGRASIASLLPRTPGDGLRVVVAGRPSPQLPPDVRRITDHPLHSCPVRELTAFPYAAQIQARAAEELDELLAGAPHERDLVGVITAAGGGLALRDLEELTGLPPYRLEGLLRGVCGRTVVGRNRFGGQTGTSVYLLAHETLREVAHQRLGKSVADYRDRLHTWAGVYRQQRWPAETPSYLLRGYPRMLAEASDTGRLVALGTDPARLDRLRDESGGDATALAEIRTCQELLLAAAETDVRSLIALSYRRNELEGRNTRIPTGLPALWASLGQPLRAEALAYGIAEPGRRSASLTALFRVVASDHTTCTTEGADKTAIAEGAEQAALAIHDRYGRTKALDELADASAAAGDLARAERLLRSVDYRPAHALFQLARLSLAAGDPDRASRAAIDAERQAISLAPGYDRDSALAVLAGVVSALGDPDRAERIARSLPQTHRDDALTGLVRAAVRAGDFDRAEKAAGSVDRNDKRTEAMAVLAEAVAASGDIERARNLLARISYEQYGPAAAAVACALAAVGEVDRAEEVAGGAVFPAARTSARAVLAAWMAAAGDLDRPERIARYTDAPGKGDRVWALADLVRLLAATGDQARAQRVVAEAEHASQYRLDLSRTPRSLLASKLRDKAQALVDLAGAVAAAGDPGRAGRWRRRPSGSSGTGTSTKGGHGRRRSTAWRWRWRSPVTRAAPSGSPLPSPPKIGARRR